MKALILGLCVFALSCGGGNSSSVGEEADGDRIPAGTMKFVVQSDNGPDSYTINDIDNPSLILARGQTYTFILGATGHPFWIMSSPGTNTSNAYSSGVTGNGSQTGTLTFTVPASAPSTLYYNCSVHSTMGGTITVTN
jgi:plastocyanin